MRVGVRAAAAVLVLAGAGCAQTQWRSDNAGPVLTLRDADQTVDIEESDRVARFSRLAETHATTPPSIEQLVLLAASVAGSRRSVPVMRIVFADGELFPPSGDGLRAEAAPILEIVAQAMQHDVPDVRLTVLGHTDASGAASGNEVLSQRRALGVMQSLIARGVNPGQLSVVAIGSAQPVAPNDTPRGRALNRRVEFLISPSEQANMQAVSMRVINPAFLQVGAAHHVSVPHRVAVLKPSYSGVADISEAATAASASGSPGSPGSIVLAATGHDITVGAAGEATGSPITTQ